MSDRELLDSIILSLADQFEAHKTNSGGVIVQPVDGEWEELRAFLARQDAEGLMFHVGSGKPSWTVRLAAEGYMKYLPLINAKRKLG